MTTFHYVIFWLIVITSVVVGSLLSYSLVHFQRKSTRNPNPDRRFRDPPMLGLIWTLVPVGLLIVLLVLTFQTMRLTR